MNISIKNKIINLDLLDFFILILPISMFVGNLIININVLIIIIIGIKDNYSKIVDFIGHKYQITLIVVTVILLNLILSNEMFLTSKGIVNLIKNTLLSIILYFWLCKKNSNLKKLFISIIISFLVVALSVYLDFINNNINDISYDRISGIFFDEKVAGSYICKFIIIFFLYFYFYNKKNSYQYLYLLILFLTYISILLTGDRTPMVMSSIVIFFILLFQKKIFLINKLTVIFFLLISFVFTYSISSNLRHKILYSYGELGLNDLQKYLNVSIIKLYLDKNYNIQGCGNDFCYQEVEFIKNKRFAHFSKAYEIGKSNLFFGSGIKSFRKECFKSEYTNKYLKQFNNDFSCATHPHNIYFEFFSDTGIVGLSIFIFGIFLLYRKLFTVKNYNIKILLLANFFILFFPFQPTGSFFSTFNSIFYFTTIPIMIYLNNNFKNF